METATRENTNSNDNLIDVKQQSIRAVQEEFRTEFNALRATIPSLTQTTSPSTDRPTASNDLEDRIPAITSIHRSNISQNKIDLEKWKVKFDGTGNVSDFLFKIDTLCKRTQCTDEHLMANFQIFLNGKADKWYWEFIKQNNDPTYSLLEYSLSQEFGSLETDHDVLLRIHVRKQQQKESYDDFYSLVVSMNSRMKDPIPERRLIDILKEMLIQI